MSLPNCPKCHSEYVYEDQAMLICPECAYEWNPHEVEVDEDALIIKDATGKQLHEGDKVTLAKDLKVKGSSQVLKIGTKATIKRLVDGDHDIDCKVDGAGDMMLKSQFVKKASA
ncbi:zinc ribbon domain-containing protein YjdM [Marinomonas sp. THO17]|uniref:zinc ribbon domain-containing protein YjdM n=1 Tax=Marinomonas sp. THO17 TaxID=3149048 RepID=UPI00336C1AF4